MKKEEKIIRKNYFMIDNVYVTDYARHLGVIATAVYTSLCKHANSETQICFPSMETIAEQHGIDRHTVSRALKRLEVWNIIQTTKGINRKLKRRKNNQYKLINKELWRKIPDSLLYPVHSLYTPSIHGIKDTMSMVSKLPHDGTEDTSNKTHIIRPIEEDSLCGEPTELPLSLYKKLQLLQNRKDEQSKLGVWSSDKAIQSLINNDCKDYQIIGEYFLIHKLFFSDKLAFKEKLKRSLRPAKALLEYKIDDIRKTMQWLDDRDFDFSEMGGWSLEAVIRYIDDCIATDFIPDGEERGSQLNIINA